MLSVQNYSMNTPQVSFKQNEEKASDNKAFETHAGLKTGAIAGGIGAASTLSLYALADKLVKSGKDAIAEGAEELGKDAVHEAGNFFSEASAQLKAAGKKLWITIPIGLAVYSGCGALIDKLTNDSRAKFAQDNAGKDTKEILKNNSDAELTRGGEVYQKSSIGKKYGALLGAVVLPLWAKSKSLITKAKSPVGIIGNVITGALGGLILGAITDHYSNKGAVKHADKMAA